VRSAFLTAIRSGNATDRIMGDFLAEGDYLVVESLPPLATDTGKVVHLLAKTRAKVGVLATTR
jgi:hypothetical protein